ncbi:helix-turn-helix domain-containing protein [Streptomyces anulatus]|uniref:helix-turn-helix domain-containing protein n=1 Tax=Streptomyces anulatus TaxID=1892 RepID=UPI001C2713EB|nr:helix-turn-helix domain-containing protein [Streptomyces anulatus]
MTPRETLPELIHRLIEEKGRPWVERELSYAPQTVDAHLAAYARGRATGPGPVEPSRVSAQPVHQAQIARYLGVHRETLNRALRNDPAAPQPAPGTDGRGRLWRYADIYAWWPRRRSRGQYPRAAEPEPARPGEAPA